MTYVFNQDLEQFLPIAGYPDYEVGDHGTIRSLKFGKVRVLKERINSNGYLCVVLHYDGYSKNFLVHKLVAGNFIENREQKKQVNHLDGVKKNNNSNNLECATQEEENIQHAWANGLCEKVRENLKKTRISYGKNNAGENHGCCKLSDDDCEKIKKIYSTGLYSQKQIGDDFGVSDAQISNIIRGKRKPTPVLETH